MKDFFCSTTQGSTEFSLELLENEQERRTELGPQRHLQPPTHQNLIFQMRRMGIRIDCIHVENHEMRPCASIVCAEQGQPSSPGPFLLVDPYQRPYLGLLSQARD